jgi:hypothetical protein
MIITEIHIHKRINGSDRVQTFEDDKTINSELELEIYRDQIEKAFLKIYKNENPGEIIKIECLFSLKN